MKIDSSDEYVTQEIKINEASKKVSIEPVGVIVIGIDGLRQDVLYPAKRDGEDFENVQDSEDYYVNPNGLNGLGQILLGDPEIASTQQYTMLPGVTAVFPSITLASWASIFTGKQPGETGILGNEFFARDLISYESSSKQYEWTQSIPSMDSNPVGMITLSEGAFPRGTFDHQSLTPLNGQWESSPQNNLLQTPTVYEALEDNPIFTNYFTYKGAKPRVTVFQHYARGADEWITLDWWNIWKFMPSVAYGLDEIPGDHAEKWLNENLLDEAWLFKKRNDIPFPGLFMLYFAGLDHEAHVAGMTGYTKFLRETTDDEIEDLVNWLKKYGEFDNKIFIITSDHGHTAMAEFGEVSIEVGAKQITVTPDTSCKLKLNGFEDEDVQYAERYNNNLHIWELGNLFRFVGKEVGLD